MTTLGALVILYHPSDAQLAGPRIGLRRVVDDEQRIARVPPGAERVELRVARVIQDHECAECRHAALLNVRTKLPRRASAA